MPVMNGYEVLKEVRTHPKTLKTPFFFLTSEIALDHFHELLELRVDGFIRKPMGVRELGQILTVLDVPTPLGQR